MLVRRSSRGCGASACSRLEVPPPLDLGIKGIRVERSEEIGPAWDEALAADRPVLIDAVTDPTVSMLPPELQPAQLEKIESALSQGDPDAETVRQRLEQEGYLIGRH